MNSPYKRKLDRMLEEEIRVEREGAPALDGTLKEVNDGGCVVKVLDKEKRIYMDIFVAYENIRGVGRVSSDPADW